MKKIQKKIENIFPVISLLLIAFFFNLYKEGIILVGVGQDGEYLSSDMRKIVVGVQRNKNGETIPVFNEYRNKPNTAIVESIKKSNSEGDIKLISQVLPPNYLLVYGEKEFLISAWLHTGLIPDIIQNIALKIHFSVNTLRAVNFIFLITFILSFLLASRLWFGWKVSLVSTSLVLISSPFFFFSISGPTCGRYYFLSLAFFSIGFLFLSRSIISGDSTKIKANLIFSAIFFGFSISSYFRGGIILTAVMSVLLLLMLDGTKRKISYTILFFFISVSFFLPTLIFWVIFLKYDSILPRPDDFTLFSFFPRSGLKFILSSLQEKIDIISSVKIALHDILTLYDFRFMGNDLWIDYDYQIDYRYTIFLIFFLLSLTGERKTKVIFMLSILYILLETMTFRNPGFPRRFLFVYPLMILCTVSGLLGTGKAIHKILFLFFLGIFSYTQVKAGKRIIHGIGRGVYYEIMSYKVQKNIIGEVEKIAQEVINVSCVMNFPLLSSGKVKVEDWSYIYAITRKEKRIFLNMLTERLLSENSRRTLITCFLPFSEIKKYFIEKGLNVKKVKDFYKENSHKEVISTVFTVERREKANSQKSNYSHEVLK